MINELAYTRAYFEKGLKTLILYMPFPCYQLVEGQLVVSIRMKHFEGLPVGAHKLSAQQEIFPFLPDFCQDGISLQVSYIAA